MTESEIQDFRLNFKTGMYVRAPDFQSISVQNFMIHALGLPGDGLRRGIVGIWTRAILTDAAGKEYLWTCLDIEAPAELHDDLEACIEVAQEFWLMLREYGLIDDRMMIFLTGRGFRFSWPYIVSEEYKEAFLLWIKSTPAIDASPFLKRAHYRHLAYRGHRNQGKPRDTHIELLPKNIYIFDLDVVEYTRWFPECRMWTASMNGFLVSCPQWRCRRRGRTFWSLTASNSNTSP